MRLLSCDEFLTEAECTAGEYCMWNARRMSSSRRRVYSSTISTYSSTSADDDDDPSAQVLNILIAVAAVIVVGATVLRALKKWGEPEDTPSVQAAAAPQRPRPVAAAAPRRPRPVDLHEVVVKAEEFSVATGISSEGVDFASASYPAYWKTQTAKGHAFEQESDEMKRAVQALIDRTWKDQRTRDRDGDDKLCKFEVLMVHRNENPKLWSSYDRTRRLLALTSESKCQTYDAKTKVAAADVPEVQRLLARSELMEDANECLLFHGTKPSAAKSICQDDFMVKLCGSHAGTLYGPGIYFAEASSKSDEYAEDDKEGIFAGLFGMLICRVACGKIKYNDEVKPPVSELVSSVMKKRTHHSILGDREACRGTYREFVVFDRNQAYPEYVVIYRRVPASA